MSQPLTCADPSVLSRRKLSSLVSLAADINGSEALVWVVLWREDGRVDGLEISWIEEPHPALADLVIVE